MQKKYYEIYRNSFNSYIFSINFFPYIFLTSKIAYFHRKIEYFTTIFFYIYFECT